MVSNVIKKITEVVVRTYSDTSQTVVYVHWIDHKGVAGRTEGSAQNPHIQALSDRAHISVFRSETW